MNSNVNDQTTGVNQPVQNIQPASTTQNAQPTQNVGEQVYQQMQSIPTIDQNKQEFINNTQATNSNTKEEKKGSINMVFVIILFVVIFAAIFLLFPYIFKNLG